MDLFDIYKLYNTEFFVSFRTMLMVLFAWINLAALSQTYFMEDKL